MLRFIFAALFTAICFPTLAQDNFVTAQKLLPPNMTKADFFGEIFAVIAFCNLTYYVDQYELSALARFFGVASADRAAMETIRDKKYQEFRRQFTTPAKHQDFCTTSVQNPIFVKIKRSGFPSIPGSDYRRQPEKIEFFGDMLGTMTFCKIPTDGEKLGRILFEMGVQSESMNALQAEARKHQQELAAQYGTPQGATQVCSEVRANPGIDRFTKR
jgi:hypothetical protein